MAKQTKTIGPLKVKYGSREEMLAAKAKERAENRAKNAGAIREAYKEREYMRKYANGDGTARIPDPTKEDLDLREFPQDIVTEHLARKLYKSGPTAGRKYDQQLKSMGRPTYDEQKQIAREIDRKRHTEKQKAEQKQKATTEARAQAAEKSTRKRTDNVNMVPIEEYKPKKQKMESLKSVAAKGFDSAW